jgi:ABC-type nitrate/sulfonate/bicarbonate transport system permease component
MTSREVNVTTSASVAAQPTWPAENIAEERLPWIETRVGKVVAPSVVVAAFLALWQVITAAGLVHPLVLPSPATIFAVFVRDGAMLLENAGYTALEALAGFVIGNIVGLLLAIAVVDSQAGRRTVYPLALVFHAMPVVAISPALMLWLGSGLAPKIFVTSFLVFFPMSINGLRGLQSADASLSELLYTLSASRWQRLIKVRLPASLPFVFSALRLAACACFVAAIVAEWVSADRGLGYVIVAASLAYETEKVWAAVLIGTVLSMVVYGFVVVAEWLVTPWARNAAVRLSN